nr:hypothetical protein [Tanacetum cinerariifolium]
MVKSLEGGVKFYLLPRFLQVLLDKQVEGMARHKEMYVISSHTKKIFTNMRRIGAGFSRKPQNPRRKQRKEAETSHDESADEDHVPTPSSDPLPSGEDSSILNELMVFSTSLQEQGRMIEEIDQNVEIALDDEMFGVDDLAGEDVVIETTTGIKDSDALTTDVIEDEISIAQALAALKSVKPKVVARLLVDLIEKRKKHFADLRAQEKRNKPPTKTQMKIQMSTYLRHIGGYKQSHLKGKSFDEIKELVDREMRKVNDFVAIDLEAQKSSAKEEQESSTKRTAKHLESNISKKQKVDENVEPVVDDSKELRKCIEIVLDDGDEVLIEATPISSRSPTIIDYKIHKEGKKTYFKIIRADGNSQVYQTFKKCLGTLIEKI